MDLLELLRELRSEELPGAVSLRFVDDVLDLRDLGKYLARYELLQQLDRQLELGLLARASSFVNYDPHQGIYRPVHEPKDLLEVIKDSVKTPEVLTIPSKSRIEQEFDYMVRNIQEAFYLQNREKLRQLRDRSVLGSLLVSLLERSAERSARLRILRPSEISGPECLTRVRVDYYICNETEGRYWILELKFLPRRYSRETQESYQQRINSLVLSSMLQVTGYFLRAHHLARQDLPGACPLEPVAAILLLGTQDLRIVGFRIGYLLLELYFRLLEHVLLTLLDRERWHGSTE